MGRRSILSIAAIGGAAALILAILITLLVRFLIFQSKHLHTHSSSSPNSETASSDPSAAAATATATGDAKRRNSPGHEHADAAAGRARQFRMEELEQATMEFNESNIIGCGAFGLVFKGLLRDGTVVAIKRRHAPALLTPHFANQVAYLSTIQHRNLVTLLGYCQERDCQMLVFEYLPNSSISNHLYVTGSNDSTTKLEFKQRLSVAIGAAKGLCHLHGLQPPSVHSNFKTSNVLVDENFIAKVSDAGLSKLLEKIEEAAGSSCSNSFNAFKDPECGASSQDRNENDVYSFGVFLLELISGKEASNDSIYQWVQEHQGLDNLIDQRLIGSFTEEGMKDLIKIMMKCMRFPGRERPRMENVVLELDRIHENEITRTMVTGEGTATVTLGSHLFTN